MDSSVTPFEKLREGILAKAKQQAEEIIAEAKKRAEDILRQAREKKLREIEEARKRLRDEIGYDTRIAEAKIKARYIVTEVKNEILKNLREKILNELRALPYERRRVALENILRELNELNAVPRDQKIRIYVNERDIDTVKEIVRVMQLQDIVAEIKPIDIIGGIIIETADGSMRIDASFEKRLEQILRYRMSILMSKLFS